MTTVGGRAVVTGGAGFLGSHLCARLLEEQYEVVCLDSFLTGRPGNVQHLLPDEAFRLVRTDVTDYVDVPGPVDAVLHFASPASPVDYLKLPIETLKVGSTGTLHALGLAREKGARFLLASTSETYGDPQVHPQREDYWGHVNPVGPRGVYDEAKRYAEALTMAYRRTHGVDTAIVRIFNTFGPGMRPDDGRAIPTFIWQALTGRPITVAGDGSQTRSVCYVDDLIEGLVRLLRSDLAGPVNIGNPEELSVRQLAEEIRLLCSADVDIVHVPGRRTTRRCASPGRPARQSVVRRIMRDPGWVPAALAARGRRLGWLTQDRVAGCAAVYRRRRRTDLRRRAAARLYGPGARRARRAGRPGLPSVEVSVDTGVCRSTASAAVGHSTRPWFHRWMASSMFRGGDRRGAAVAFRRAASRGTRPATAVTGQHDRPVVGLGLGPAPVRRGIARHTTPPWLGELLSREQPAGPGGP